MRTEINKRDPEVRRHAALLPLWRVPVGSALRVDLPPSDEVLPSTVRADVIQVPACMGSGKFGCAK